MWVISCTDKKNSSEKISAVSHWSHAAYWKFKKLRILRFVSILDARYLLLTNNWDLSWLLSPHTFNLGFSSLSGDMGDIASKISTTHTAKNSPILSLLLILRLHPLYSAPYSTSPVHYHCWYRYFAIGSASKYLLVLREEWMFAVNALT